MAASFDLLSHAYAHRGLWSLGGAPENTMAAFRAAARKGLGIEIDVRPCADGHPVIFHDETLERLTGTTGRVDTYPIDTLSRLTILDSDETIATLQELLAEWPRTLPILVELKIDGHTDPVTFARRVAAQLGNFPGQAAAMSFSEAAVRALPDTLMRGQLIPPASSIGAEQADAIARNAVTDGIDYLAPHVSDAIRVASCSVAAALQHVFWTVRSTDELMAARDAKGAIIFEQISPSLVSAGSLS